MRALLKFLLGALSDGLRRARRCRECAQRSSPGWFMQRQRAGRPVFGLVYGTSLRVLRSVPRAVWPFALFPVFALFPLATLAGLLVAPLAGAGPLTPAPAAAQAPGHGSLQLDIERFTLLNGLRVVLAPDPSTPTVAVDVVYQVGSRNEERGHSGFAHLFEHMMFQGCTSS
jgi:hypothetical protein